MTREPNQALVTFYKNRIAEHGFNYEAMWGDTASWKSDIRFAPLLTLPLAAGDRIVDIGCGTAGLAGFLVANGLDLDYLGIEAVSEFAEQARAGGHDVLELDAFRNLDGLPMADWYVTFGTLNKSWSVADLPGTDDQERIYSLIEKLFARANKGVAASFVTNVVEFTKPGVINLNPARTAERLSKLSAHFTVYHGYPFYEFFAGAWKSERR